MIYALGERRLRTAGSDYYVAPSAQLIGSVTLGRGASVWFNCVLRADQGSITVGDATNVQDGTIAHMDDGDCVAIGDQVTIGHRVLLHGCAIGDGSLVGNGAILLDRARLGRNCLVAAGALVPPDSEVPDGHLIMGAPGRVVRRVTDSELSMMRAAVEHYLARCEHYRRTLLPEPRGPQPA